MVQGVIVGEGWGRGGGNCKAGERAGFKKKQKQQPNHQHPPSRDKMWEEMPSTPFRSKYSAGRPKS